MIGQIDIRDMRALLIRTIFVTSLIIGEEHTLNAQLAPGARIRVRHAAGCCQVWTTGNFVALTPESLSVSANGSGVTVSVPRDSVRSVERSTPGEGHAREGAVVGGVVGAIGAWLIGTAAERCEATEVCLKGIAVGVDTAVGGLAGLIVGGIIGSEIRDESWLPVDLRLAMRPDWRGDQRTLRVAGTVRF
jgi:hypothetical protein